MSRTSYRKIIDRIIKTGEYTDADLKKLYRMLSKQTHPDINGGSTEEFKKMCMVISEAQKRLEGSDSIAAGTGSFDPVRVFADAGYNGPYVARPCLYKALHRYYHLDIHTYRIRANPKLLQRNELVVKTILYWGRLYDPDFCQIFTTYHQTNVFFSIASKQPGKYSQVKNLFYAGFMNFLYYQSGKYSEFKMKYSRELLHSARNTLTAQVSPSHPFLCIIDWLVNELEKPCLNITLYE